MALHYRGQIVRVKPPSDVRVVPVMVSACGSQRSLGNRANSPLVLCIFGRPRRTQRIFELSVNIRKSNTDQSMRFSLTGSRWNLRPPSPKGDVVVRSISTLDFH